MPEVQRPQMEDYGVPASVEGALPWSWADERLERCRNYWLVTVSSAGVPHAMPVWGAWIDERFGFSCSPNAKKVRNIASNPHVVVAVDDTVECVSVQGVASPASEAEAEFFAAAIGCKYEADPAKQAEMTAFMLSHAMFVVVPQRAYGIIEREEEFATRATRWAW